jgi:hypothetical protein
MSEAAEAAHAPAASSLSLDFHLKLDQQDNGYLGISLQ